MSFKSSRSKNCRKKINKCDRIPKKTTLFWRYPFHTSFYWTETSSFSWRKFKMFSEKMGTSVGCYVWSFSDNKDHLLDSQIYILLDCKSFVILDFYNVCLLSKGARTITRLQHCLLVTNYRVTGYFIFLGRITLFIHNTIVFSTEITQAMSWFMHVLCGLLLTDIWYVAVLFPGLYFPEFTSTKVTSPLH